MAQACPRLPRGPPRQSRRAGGPTHPAAGSGSPGTPAGGGGRAQARGRRGCTASQRAGAGPGSAGLPVQPSPERPGWTGRAGTGAWPARPPSSRLLSDTAGCSAPSRCSVPGPALSGRRRRLGPGTAALGAPGAFTPPAGHPEPAQPGRAGAVSAGWAALGINRV